MTGIASPRRRLALTRTIALTAVALLVGTACEPEPPAPVPISKDLLQPTGRDLAEGEGPNHQVLLMQNLLMFRGFWLEDGQGMFGASTRHAVTAFQKYIGIPRTGRLDAKTRLFLATSLAKAAPRSNNGGRLIEIDLNRQILTVSTAGVTNMVLDISSGKSSTPTPRGNFRIQRQIDGMRVSALGRLWRPKYFTGGYALHGSSSVPTYPASHGCVRLTNTEINHLWASGLAPVGTPVTVY